MRNATPNPLRSFVEFNRTTTTTTTPSLSRDESQTLLNFSLEDAFDYIESYIFFALIILISFVHSDESPVLAKLYSINEQTRGSDIVLTCNVAKGSKPLRFQWFKNGVELSNTGRSTIENKDIFSFFTLRNIDSNDVGNYSSKPILNKFPASEINLSINSSYILPCSISSGSTSIFFEWYKDDHKKLSSTEYKIVIYDTMSSIVFKRLNSNDDTGTYTCNARNVHGTDSITTKLVIQDAPRISKLFSTELNQSEGSVLNIPCSVISGSTPLSFKWFKNEQELLRHRNPELSYQIKTDNFLSFLTISKLKAADSGNYSCIKNGKEKLKPDQIRNRLWVFVNCFIENETFDSRTKEMMILQSENFAFKCVLSEKFFQSTMKIGIFDSILSWIRFKPQTEMDEKLIPKKRSKIISIPKLEDAYDAGSMNSLECTLIVTEGDSAHTIVNSGISVVNRNKFGIFPLNGKFINVREANKKQIMGNIDIKCLVEILGLKYNMKYTTEESMKSLRYGRLMIMTDQDPDGAHITGLIINFIHYYWPTLIKQNFIERFITPVIKVSNGSSFNHAFYSLAEFKDWKQKTWNSNSYHTRYYKGLAGSSPHEAKEYFLDMKRHRITFRYDNKEDDESIELVFSMEKLEAKKQWLIKAMEERYLKPENGEKQNFLYNPEKQDISFKEFIYKDYSEYYIEDNIRSISIMTDGFKPGQRKVIYFCIQRNDDDANREVKVAQLAALAAEFTSYNHGEKFLMPTIIKMGQNFVGTNNLTLFQTQGQFGLRLNGGSEERLYGGSDESYLKLLVIIRKRLSCMLIK
ncbi:DNA topoisomerase 2-beta [Dermatophagoides farinae]|uniref:DNA topoisomerase 2 n=1 Tax=Dermatophagoides farinae TaxID=6954 RepID=A0A922IBN4_DERFA|nr:DNA topoisomerase 2-beta [Dermatophagoides farinae]